MQTLQKQPAPKEMQTQEGYILQRKCIIKQDLCLEVAG